MGGAMDFGVLGPLVVRDGGGERRVPPGRQRRLLALLLLHARTTVTAERLIAALWGEDTPDDPANALQGGISRLRKLVDPEHRGDVLVWRGAGYALDVADGAIDARRFERLAAEGHRVLVAGDAARARELLARSLGLWHGDALEEFAGEEWAAGEATRLEELRLAAIEDRVDADLALGRHRRLVSELEALVKAHPLRERLRGQLMLALYRSGRQADAMAVYQQARALLAEELGADPGPELERVHLAVLQHQVVPGGEAAEPSPPGTPRGNLPARATSFVGREDAVEQVHRLLGRARLVTLTGPGGAGKTRLAVEAADRLSVEFPDGAWLVELDRVTPTAAAASAVAEVLDVGGGAALAGAGGGADLVEELVIALASRRVLLVLDNCEHVLDDVVQLVCALLAGCPQLRVLATSREPLGVDGEVLWSVPTLPVPAADLTDPYAAACVPAVRLLVDRAQDHIPGFVLDAPATPHAVEIVRRLEGVPLAIELAAARLRVLSLAEVSAGLADRFALLAAGRRSAPSRQRTLRATLDWSWELLDDPGRLAWAVLAVPAGPFPLSLAADLLAGTGGEPLEPLDAVAGLLDRSLLSVHRGEPTRYRMLDTVRDYGLERLADLGLHDELRRRHARAVQAALDAADKTTPARWAVDLDEQEAWLNEARTALQWAVEGDEAAIAQRLAGRLGWLWWLRGLAAEGRRWLDAALPDPDSVDAARADPDALLWAGILPVTPTAEDTEPAGRGLTWAELAVAAAREPFARALAQVLVVAQRAAAGQVEAALADLAAAEETLTPQGGWALGAVQLIAGQIALGYGDTAAASAAYTQARRLLSEGGAWWALMYVVEGLAVLAERDGDYQQARALAEEALALCRTHRAPELEVGILVQLGVIAGREEQAERAAALVDEAVKRAERAGVRGPLAAAHNARGHVARQNGDLAAARDAHRAALAVTAPSPGVHTAQALSGLGFVSEASGEVAEAFRHHAESLDICVLTGEPRATAVAIEGLAGAAARANDAVSAGMLLGAAAAVRETSGAPPLVRDRDDIDRITAHLRAELGDEALHEAWHEGHVLTPEQAVAAARARLGPQTS